MKEPTFFIILGILFLFVLVFIGLDIYRTRFCSHCGCKMSRFYDTEEDAEVYQCPNCGRCYIINN